MGTRWASARVLAVAAMLLSGFADTTAAEEPANIPVTLQDHRFTPSEIRVPQGKPVILTITNRDNTAEEFDSTALKIEKVIPGGAYGTVRLRPLGPGRYPFMGEFHPDTASGAVVAE